MGANDGCDCMSGGSSCGDPDCGGASAPSAPAKLGAIGDSISAGMDSDDDCQDGLDCMFYIGEDRSHSWTTGASLAQSIRNVRGFSSTVEMQVNGSRWEDAPGQAQGLLAAGGAQEVTIELGGNDVCRGVNATLSTKAEIKGHIHNTLSILVNAPAAKRPSMIIIASTPDVVSLRNTMRNQSNAVFETCQDLWDIDTGAVDLHCGRIDHGCDDYDCAWYDAICWAEQGVCYTGEGAEWAACEATELVASLLDPVLDMALDVFDASFPCGYVLNRGSNDTKRALARAFNIEINDAIGEEVAAFQGVNGVSIRYASNVFNYQFTVDDVSYLDGFHPSRLGQRHLAEHVKSGADL